MWINGRGATGGTIIIEAGQSAELQLPFGRFALTFESSPTRGIRLNASPAQINFSGFESSLGTSGGLDIPMTGGQTYRLVFAIYVIGDGSSATRILHYTVS